MFKPYLRSIVRNGGKGRMGLGVELFRLDTADEEELTTEELEEAEEVKESATGVAIMRIYEEIGEDFWTGAGVTAKKFAEELDSFGDVKRLHIHINSLGGDVFTAQAIHSIISDYKAKKLSFIDGVAASAATVVACAANEVVGRLNTSYMIHYPWAVAIGNAETMRKAADDLEAITTPIVNVYRAQVRDKIDEDRIRELMEGETWMSADEALEYGFVDRIKGKIKAIAKVSKTKILCSGRTLDVGKYHYRNVPKFPLIEANAAVEQKPQQKKEIKKMTKEEIDPQLVASIEDDARTRERERLNALDAMDGPGVGDIIAKAKVEGKQPGDIAMECYTITKNQLAAANATGALARDAAPASKVQAGEAPLPKREETPQKKATGMLVNAFKGQRPRGAAVPSGNGN